MVWRAIREHPKRTFGWVVVAVLIMLCLHFGFRGRNQTEKQASENAKWQKCVVLHERMTNVTTVDEYKNFNFRPNWMAGKEFWDSTMQKRYEQVIANKTRPNLKVILVPFSHNDPGWLKTFTTYFDEDTRFILDTVITKMEEYKDMTFVWAELSFLQLWWDQAASSKRRSLRELIRSGRFEIVTGGWVMADEASSRVYGLINQLVEGHQWLRENLNFTPSTGFSIDPFGHGSTLPYLLAATGFDGMIIQRVHFAWKHFLATKQYDDFHWSPYWDDGSDSSSRTMLTHNMPFDIYSIEGSCGPHPKICKQFNFPEPKTVLGKPATNITDDNIQERADLLVDQYAMTGSIFPHNVALMPLGGDFEYKTNASVDARYINYKKLADYVNAHPERYNHTYISFGLPRDYFAEIKKRQTDYPHLKGDFFVYADIFSTGNPGYWSGFYTTRPQYKMLDRELEHNLRSAEILYTIGFNRARKTKDERATRIFVNNYEKLILARRNLGLFQHHDGITGTSKVAVMKDYGTRLFTSIQDTVRMQEQAIEILLQNTTRWHDFVVSDVKRGNVNELPRKTPIQVGPNRSGDIVLFNSLAQPRTELISVHTTTQYVKLFDDRGNEVKIQINPLWNFTDPLDNGAVDPKSFYTSTDAFELQFVANLQPLSLAKYTVKYWAEGEQSKRPTSSAATIFGTGFKENATHAMFEVKPMPSGDIQLENRLLRLVCNGTNGLLKSISSKNRNKTVLCDIEFSAYQSVPFRSGAYLFEPNKNTLTDDILHFKDDAKVVFIISGPLTSEVTMVHNNFLIHTIRIFKTGTALDGGIVIKNDINFGVSSKTIDAEFYMRLATNISNGANPVFYSDQNGFQYQRREKVEALGVEGNYYPITTGAFIQDEAHRLTLLTAHAQGAASLGSGQLEVMMDRRIRYDDNRGMGEGLSDSQRTLQNFWLILEDFNEPKPKTIREYETPSHFVNQLSNMHNYPVGTFIVDDQNGGSNAPLQLNARHSLFDIRFPCDVHLSTFRMQSETSWSKFPSQSAFLMLHRQASTCQVNDIGFVCENDHGIIAKSLNLAKDLTLKSAEMVSLTGLKSIGPINSFDQIFIKPMDIITLNTTFI